MAGPGTRLPSWALGASVAAVAGVVFVVANAGALGRPGAGALRLLAVAAFGACLLGVVRVVRARREPAPPQPVRLGPRYWAVVAGEVALIVLGRNLLAGVLDLRDAVLPWVTLVVGVHFFALALVLRARFYHLLALALTACALAGFGFALTPGDATAAIALTAGVCPGFVLLAASLWGLRARTSDRPVAVAATCTGGSGEPPPEPQR